MAPSKKPINPRLPSGHQIELTRTIPSLTTLKSSRVERVNKTNTNTCIPSACSVDGHFFVRFKHIQDKYIETIELQRGSMLILVSREAIYMEHFSIYTAPSDIEKRVARIWKTYRGCFPVEESRGYLFYEILIDDHNTMAGGRKSVDLDCGGLRITNLSHFAFVQSGLQKWSDAGGVMFVKAPYLNRKDHCAHILIHPRVATVVDKEWIKGSELPRLNVVREEIPRTGFWLLTDYTQFHKNAEMVMRLHALKECLVM